jgi:hypothetical protein
MRSGISRYLSVAKDVFLIPNAEYRGSQTFFLAERYNAMKVQLPPSLREQRDEWIILSGRAYYTLTTAAILCPCDTLPQRLDPEYPKINLSFVSQAVFRLQQQRL